MIREGGKMYDRMLDDLSYAGIPSAVAIFGLHQALLYQWNRKRGMVKVGFSFVGVRLSTVPFATWQKSKKTSQPAYEHEYAYLAALVVPWVYGLIIEVCNILLGTLQD